MYFFAHVFSGALIGLAFWYIIRDRRVLPLCIFGAVLPDLLDKPLALLFPGILGTNRTIGHSLLFFAGMVAAGMLLWHYRHILLGMAFACAVFSHQIFDSMWNLAGTWFFPLMGPFPVILIPDYVQHSLWLELSSPSELVFALASAVIILAWSPGIAGKRLSSLPPQGKSGVCMAAACLLGAMGAYLLFAGLNASPGSFFAPAYAPLTSVMAGCLALCGTIVLLSFWHLSCFQDR
ncbi:MAG: metal-dependent hydrolase [Methanoregula sp.]|jgi:hypothetical protein|nr:metal-dependent hydrolase [Methanoregula sp.]